MVLPVNDVLIPGIDLYLGPRWGENDVQQAIADGRLAEHMAEHGFYLEDDPRGR